MNEIYTFIYLILMTFNNYIKTKNKKKKINKNKIK